MDNKDLAKELAAKASLTEEQALSFVNAFAEVLADLLKKGEKVVIAEFGNFVVREDKTIQFTSAAFSKKSS